MTKTLCDLGLGDEVVGCTTFCVDPPGLAAQRLGGTKDPDLAQIRSLAPTHILANREENTREIVAGCEELAPTLVSHPRSPHDVLAMISDLAGFLGLQPSPAWEALRRGLEQQLALPPPAPPKGAPYLYFIWRDPWMVAGPGTYIAALLATAGWRNVAPASRPYPSLTWEEIRGCGAETIFLASEPWPFRRRDAAVMRQELGAGPRLIKADGKLLSWHGSLTLPALIAVRDGRLFGPELG